MRTVAEVHHLAHRLGEAHVRFLHARPVGLREVGAQRVHQPLRLRAERTARGPVGGAQHGLGVPGIVDGGAGFDREGGGDVHMVGRHAEGQQPVRAVEPLAVVVDEAAAGVGHQRAHDRHAHMARLGQAREGGARGRIAPVGAHQQVDVVDRVLHAALRVAHGGPCRVAGARADGIDLAAVADRRARPGAQHAVQLRPADADARVVGHLRERQVEQRRAIGQRHLPALPRQAGGLHLGGQRRVAQAQRLDRVGADVEAGAGLRMVLGAHALEAVQRHAGQQGQAQAAEGVQHRVKAHLGQAG